MALRGKMWGVAGISLAMILGLFACAPVTVLNTITPSASFSKLKNISYGALERQKLDIYKPANAKVGAPVLVFIHGGSWTEGSKDIYKFLAEGFTSEGYEVVVPNYRLYPQGRFPDMITDSAEAVSYAARSYPGRPLILMGHSAGGYNVMMLATDKTYLEKAGTDLCARISGVISLAAPTGAYPLKEEPYITIFPDRFTKGDAPLNLATAPIPPVFMINGADDKTVGPKNARVLAEKVEMRGGKSRVGIYDGLNHIDVIKNLSRHFDGSTELKADIVRFIDAHAAVKDNYCH